MARYRLRLLGAFQLIAPNGQRLDVTSKKAIALLGLLASAQTGERWRGWIQDKLWGSRELRQAQASLRRIEKWALTSEMRCSVQLFSSLTPNGVEAAREVIAGWLDLPLPEPREKTKPQNKNPRLKGSKAGGKNALIGIKAPAQGGEAGDDETSSVE